MTNQLEPPQSKRLRLLVPESNNRSTNTTDEERNGTAQESTPPQSSISSDADTPPPQQQQEQQPLQDTVGGIHVPDDIIYLILQRLLHVDYQNAIAVNQQWYRVHRDRYMGKSFHMNECSDVENSLLLLSESHYQYRLISFSGYCGPLNAMYRAAQSVPTTAGAAKVLISPKYKTLVESDAALKALKPEPLSQLLVSAMMFPNLRSVSVYNLAKHKYEHWLCMIGMHPQIEEVYLPCNFERPSRKFWRLVDEHISKVEKLCKLVISHAPFTVTQFPGTKFMERHSRNSGHNSNLKVMKISMNGLESNQLQPKIAEIMQIALSDLALEHLDKQHLVSEMLEALINNMFPQISGLGVFITMPMYDEGTGGRSMANDQLRLWADVLYARTRAMRENEIERPSQTYFVELSLEGSLKQFEGPEEQWKWNTEKDFAEHFYPRVGPHISHLRVVNSQYNKILMDDKPVYYDPILTILKSKLVEVVEGQEVVTEVSFDWNNEVIITHLPHPAVREQVASILKEKKRIPKLERVVLGQYLYDKDPVSAKEFFDSLLPLDVVYDRHPNAHNEYTAVDDPDSPEITDDEEEEEEEVEIL